MIKSVVVLGGGSAGYLAAMALKKRVPALSVKVIRSKEIGVIGVGESTTVGLPVFLHGFLDVDQAEFYRRVQPSWKLGINFLWGPRKSFDYTFGIQLDWQWDRLPKTNGFYCDDEFENVDIPSALMAHKKAFIRRPNGDPQITRHFGYHIDNARFVAYLEDKATEMGVPSIDDVMTSVEQNDQGITKVHLASGTSVEADLWLDCTGFRSLLLGKALKESYTSFKSTLFCDRAVTGTWRRTDEIINPYTTAETMEAGWCWQIDHPDSIMRGYVYSSSFLSDEEAEREFRGKNPKVTDTRIIHFASGCYQRSWVKNVVAIGNAAGFVEPLESTSLAVIADESRMLAEILHQSDREPTHGMIASYNEINLRSWNIIRDFLGIHYKFNTRLTNAFWRECQLSTQLGAIEGLIEYYRENGPNTFARTTLIHGNDLFGLEGYYTLLVGMKVPHRRRHVPGPEERAIWNGLREGHRKLAVDGLTVREALDVIGTPGWRWTPGFFGDRPPSPQGPPQGNQPMATQMSSYIGVKL